MPKLSKLMDDAEADVLAYMGFQPSTAQAAQHKPPWTPQRRDQASQRCRRYVRDRVRVARRAYAVVGYYNDPAASLYIGWAYTRRGIRHGRDGKTGGLTTTRTKLKPGRQTVQLDGTTSRSWPPMFNATGIYCGVPSDPASIKADTDSCTASREVYRGA